MGNNDIVITIKTIIDQTKKTARCLNHGGSAEVKMSTCLAQMVYSSDSRASILP